MSSSHLGRRRQHTAVAAPATAWDCTIMTSPNRLSWRVPHTALSRKWQQQALLSGGGCSGGSGRSGAGQDEKHSLQPPGQVRAAHGSGTGGCGPGSTDEHSPQAPQLARAAHGADLPAVDPAQPAGDQRQEDGNSADQARRCSHGQLQEKPAEYKAQAAAARGCGSSVVAVSMDTRWPPSKVPRHGLGDVPGGTTQRSCNNQYELAWGTLPAQPHVYQRPVPRRPVARDPAWIQPVHLPWRRTATWRWRGQHSLRMGGQRLGGQWVGRNKAGSSLARPAAHSSARRPGMWGTGCRGWRGG
jgi:hypothetical protein